MAAYLGYTLRMKTLFRGWPVMVHDTHTRRRSGVAVSLLVSRGVREWLSAFPFLPISVSFNPIPISIPTPAKHCYNAYNVFVIRSRLKLARIHWDESFGFTLWQTVQQQRYQRIRPGTRDDELRRTCFWETSAWPLCYPVLELHSFVDLYQNISVRPTPKILTSLPVTAASCERTREAFQNWNLQTPQHVSQESLVGLSMISIKHEMCGSLYT